MVCVIKCKMDFFANTSLTTTQAYHNSNLKIALTGTVGAFFRVLRHIGNRSIRPRKQHLNMKRNITTIVKNILCTKKAKDNHPKDDRLTAKC